MNPSDRYRLERIATTGSLLIRTLADEHIDSQSLLENYRHQWLVTTPLYIIGEQVYCLSPEFKAAHPDIEWSGIAGLRHRLVHDYEGTNWNTIAEIVETDLPIFLSQVNRLMSEA